MNTTHRTARLAAVTACLAALFAGATACGTERASSPSTAAAAGGADLSKAARANQDAYLRELGAKARASLHPNGFSDDRREPSASVTLHRSRQHAKR